MSEGERRERERGERENKCGLTDNIMLKLYYDFSVTCVFNVTYIVIVICLFFVY